MSKSITLGPMLRVRENGENHRYVFTRPISFSMFLQARRKSVGDKSVSTLHTAFKKRFWFVSYIALVS